MDTGLKGWGLFLCIESVLDIQELFQTSLELFKKVLDVFTKNL